MAHAPDTATAQIMKRHQATDDFRMIIRSSTSVAAIAGADMTTCAAVLRDLAGWCDMVAESEKQNGI